MEKPEYVFLSVGSKGSVGRTMHHTNECPKMGVDSLTCLVGEAIHKYKAVSFCKRCYKGIK